MGEGRFFKRDKQMSNERSKRLSNVNHPGETRQNKKNSKQQKSNYTHDWVAHQLFQDGSQQTRKGKC